MVFNNTRTLASVPVVSPAVRPGMRCVNTSNNRVVNLPFLQSAIRIINRPRHRELRMKTGDVGGGRSKGSVTIV